MKRIQMYFPRNASEYRRIKSRSLERRIVAHKSKPNTGTDLNIQPIKRAE